MNVRVMRLIGLLTWLAAGIPHLTQALQEGQSLGVWAVTYAAFAVLFVLNMRAISRQLTLILLAAQSVTALLLAWLAPAGSMGILLVLVAAELGAELRFRTAIIAVAAQTVVMSIIIVTSGKFESASTVILAYLMFQIFGAVASHAAVSERQARRELAQANTELRVATELLDVQTRSAERLRIARDLHDVMGHHLTALTLNLEMVDFRATPEMKGYVDKCRALTRSLLADVRDVVRRLRNDEPVDLARALRAIHGVVSNPQMHVTAPPDLLVGPVTGDVALHCMQEIATNAVRHSGARNLRLDLARRDGMLTIDARDDGRGVETIKFGHGLAGMRERVASVRGTASFESERGRGFAVHIALPLQGREGA